MWIQTLENSKGKRFKYCERFKNPVTDKTITVSVTLNTDSSHAKKSAVVMLQQKFEKKCRLSASPEQQRAEKLKSLSFWALADEWELYTRPMVKSETVKTHINYVNVLKKRIPENLHYLDLSPAKAEKIVYAMYYKEKYSFSYANATLIIIKNIMRYAKKSHYIDNIADYDEIKLKKRPATEKERSRAANKFLNHDELKECLSQLKQISPRVALVMEFMALTGLRCGELLALRVKDYDKANSSINVNGTIVKNAANGDEVQRGTPKNIYSYRDVYLNDRARQILDWFILENKKAAQWDRSRYVDRGYIFTTKNGFPYNIQYINNRLRRLDIPGKHISTHIFRHTHISMLAEMGIPVKAIMQRVGHNDPDTTLAVYTHVTDNMAAELKKKIAAMQI